MDWNRIYKHVGEVSEYTTVSFTFEYYGNKEYDSHTTSCSCIKSEWIDNKISLIFKANGVPQIAKKNGVFYSRNTRELTVKFKDGSSQVLTVEAVTIAPEYENKEVVIG
jgi:hypothetical protein